MTKKHFFIILGACALSLGIYLVISKSTYKLGFPLDDAWIHQTFARNLVTYREWSFIPGQSTSGSTAPLWTVMVAIGYLFNANPYFWTYLLGGIFLLTLSLGSELIARNQIKEYKTWFPWIGVFMATEMHFVWASGSGMETLALASAFVLIVLLLLNEQINWILVGGIIGISIWIRPEGITWLGPVIMILIIQKNTVKRKLIDLGKFFLPFLVLTGSYLYFNFELSGTLFPNTFYAKQVEYAIQLNQPFILRFFSLFSVPFVSGAFLLIPGVIYFTYEIAKTKNWKWFFILVWYTGYIAIYALLLPVTYQYGRYIMPAMGIIFITGLLGTIRILNLSAVKPIFRILKQALFISIIALALGFFIIGGKAYANNVRLIESEMVESAKWIDQNTPITATIAAHDIGALGYFGNRKIIDLAGLITPEIIPIIRNEGELSLKLDQLNADYLMTFPSWYKTLTTGKRIVFIAGLDISNNPNSDHMTVYLWK